MQEILHCETRKDRLIVLAASLVLSAIVAVACDALRYALAGPTSVGTWYNKYAMLFFGSVAFIACLFFVYRKVTDQRPEKLFFAVTLTFVLSSSLLYDINKVSWDVESHFRYMLTFTEPDLDVDMNGAEQDAVRGYAARVETSLADIAGWKNDLNYLQQFQTDDTVRTGVGNIYNRMAALPASAVYMACDVLHVPFSLAYVLTKLVLAFLYALICYFGMRQLRSGKMVYAAVAMIPTALFIAANYNYDYWLNAFMLLGVATLVGEMQRPHQRLSVKSGAIMLASFVLACGPKAIYFPMALLCLLMPRTKFGSAATSRLWRAGVVATALLIAASFLLPFVVSTPGGDARGGSDVSVAGQMAYVLGDPVNYVANILLPFMAQYLGPLNTRDYLGFFAYLGYSSWPLWLGSLFMLWFTAFTDKAKCDEGVDTWKSRTWALALAFGTLCLAATSMYLSFTPVGLDHIRGCQARYIIPVVFAVLIFIGLPKQGARLREKIPCYNLLCLGVLTLIPCISLWQTYVSAIV